MYPIVREIFYTYKQIFKQVNKYKGLTAHSNEIKAAFVNRKGKVFAFDVSRYRGSNVLDELDLAAKHEQYLKRVNHEIKGCLDKVCSEVMMNDLTLFKEKLMAVIEKNKNSNELGYVYVNPLLKVAENESEQNLIKGELEFSMMPRIQRNCDSLKEESVGVNSLVLKVCKQVLSINRWDDLFNVEEIVFDELNSVGEVFNEIN